MFKKKFSEFLYWLKDHFFFLLLIVIRLGLEKKENKVTKIPKQGGSEDETDSSNAEGI